MSESYKQRFECLLEHKNGLTLHSVHFVPRDIFDLEEKEQLVWLNLNKFDPIYFSLDGVGYCHGGKLNKNGGNIKGSTINVLESEKPVQIVLIQECVPIEQALTTEQQESWEYIMKLLVLTHELGHVEDMQKNIDSNFSYFPPRVNLVEAEAYAHSYSLNYLHQTCALAARNTLANSLYKMASSKKLFEEKLFKSICDKVGKGRIKKWARP